MKNINLGIILIISFLFAQSVFATDISFSDDGMAFDCIDEVSNAFEDSCNDDGNIELNLEFSDNITIENDNAEETIATDEIVWSSEETDIVITEEKTIEESDLTSSNGEFNDSAIDHIEEDEYIYEEVKQPDEELNQTEDSAYAANNQVNVRFDGNDSSFSDDERVVTWQVDKGTILTYWPGFTEPKRKVFIGWSTSKKRSDLLPYFRDGSYYTVTKNITLYAIWADACLITYDANGSTFYDGSKKVISKYEKGQAVSTYTSLIEPKGKRFEGWSTTRDRSRLLPFDDNGVFITPKKDVTLYAIWKACCEITFDANGWEFSNGRTTTVYKEDKGTYLNGWPAPAEREGYTYLGVNTDPKAKTALEFDDSTGGYMRVTKDVTLYFIWVKLCDITYDANGGTFENGKSKWTYTEKKGDIISSWYAHPERSGYSFVGWSKEKGGSAIKYNSKIDGYLKVSGDITLYAVWEKTGKVTLTVTPTSVTMKIGTTKKLTAKAKPSGKITYKSSDKKIATVNSSGKITAKKKGQCTIEVSCNGLKKKVKVVVK